MFFLLPLFVFIFTFFYSYSFAGDRVFLLEIKGPITTATVSYVKRGIESATYKGKGIFLIIDTPGGFDEATREIVKNLLAINVKTITFVYPRGARCASAGLFILVAGDYACMAEGTNVGSAHPVMIGEKTDRIIVEKVTQDALKFLESVSRMKGHYNPILRDMVLKSKSLTASEALSYGIINCVSNSIPDVLDRSGFKNAELVKVEKTFFEEFLSIITHPNVAYFLFLFGFYGILFELYNPGSIFPGVFGVLSLLLAMYAFSIISINWLGIMLVLLAFLLFVLEIKLPTHGLLGLCGALFLALGSIFMFYDLPFHYKPDWFAVTIGVVFTVLFFIFLIYKGIGVLKKKPVTGIEGLIGSIGVTKTKVDRLSGWVFVRGELWRAFSDEEIEVGETVEVIKVNGLRLKVKRKI
ncbi:MAG: NfeD family protein [Thermosulfidibacteraceae bacterium]|jgi:membrane-bound serine protease (ClpP class)